MNATSSSLQEKVKAWAEKEGFPLEMRLRRNFAEARFDLAQTAYLDDVTGKYRAGADLAAHRSVVLPSNWGGQLRVYAFAVVECKLGGSKPWVVFMQPHHGAGINMVQQLTSTADDRKLVESITHPDSRAELEPNLLRNQMLIAPPTVGYAIAEFEGARDKSPPFDAVRQVVDGSLGITREHKRFFSQPEHNNNTIFAAANFIVTKTPVFTCALDESGRADVRETDNVVYVDFRGQGQAQRMHYIRIVTEDYLVSKLPELSEDLLHVATALAKTLAEHRSNLPRPGAA